MHGIIGKKVGMTQVLDGKGDLVPVTVIEAGPCVVVQRKTKEKDGYDAAQIGFIECKEGRSDKATLGRFKKINQAPRKFIKEFGLDSGEECKGGDTVTVSIFEGTSHVDVIGLTKGKGFQGVVRRHRMSGGPFTHGGHSKRRVGSIGQNSFPARVLRGKRMPGHMGNSMTTMQNLEVVAIRAGDNLLLVKGAVPGPNGSIVSVNKAVKINVNKKAGKA